MVTDRIHGLFERALARHYEVTGQGVLLNSPEDEASQRTTEETYNLFLKDYEALSSGRRYSVKFWKNHNGKKSAGSYDFYKEAEHFDAPNISGMQTQNQGNMSFDTNHPYFTLQKEIWEMRKENELSDLRRTYEAKIKSATEQDSSGLDIASIGSILGRVEGVLDKVAKLRSMPAAPAVRPQVARPAMVAAPNQAAPSAPEMEGPEYDNEATSALTNNMVKIAEAVGEDALAGLIAKLAEKAESDPQAASELINQAQAFL